MFHAIPLREISPEAVIFNDCWEGAGRFTALVPRHFKDPAAFAEQQSLLSARRYERAALMDVLREQNKVFAAAEPALRNVERIADPRSVVVVGGQQAGLFGGPLYTVFKALTVLALAERLEGELGCPAIPVFWIASEDSDLAEANHACIIDADGGLREFRLPAGEAAKVPVSLVKLGKEINPLLDELASVLPQTEFGPEALRALRACYTPDKTFPQAFGSWMAWLFGERGLVLVDPSDTRLKHLAYPVFAREIREKSPVSAAVIEQTRRLARAGYEPQIELRPDMLTLFFQDPARDALSINTAGFSLKSSGRRFSAEELVGLLQESPQKFGPNAALRPLFQDSVFPTIAVVLGPSELAYFSQLSLAYERFGIPMPILFPRASLTLVEPRAEKLLGKFGLSLEEVILRAERIIDDIVKREVPPSLFSRLEEGRREVEIIWAGIVREIDRLDPTLRKTAELASGTSARQFEFMEKKIAQAGRKKDEIVRAQVQKLVAALAPRGGLQERTLGVLPFLVRYGVRAIAEAAGAIDLFSSEHRGVVIEP
jgi:bacillithiol biosynthesis cysteine-adding enzyme BshC